MPSSYQTLREFGIKATRYANYRVALVGEIAFRFLSNLAQKNTESYPELTLLLLSQTDIIKLFRITKHVYNVIFYCNQIERLYFKLRNATPLRARYKTNKPLRRGAIGSKPFGI